MVVYIIDMDDVYFLSILLSISEICSTEHILRVLKRLSFASVFTIIFTILWMRSNKLCDINLT